MKTDRATDSDAYLYDDLVSGTGETAARALLSRIERFVCKKCPDLSGEAEQLAHETVERVCEKIDTFKWESRFFTWVGGIAFNVVKEKLREKGSEPLSEAFLPELVAEYGDPEKMLLDQESREINRLVIEEALETLTEKQRTVFRLKYGDVKLTSEQIGEQLGMSANAVRSALADAHTKITRRRKRQGY